MSLLPFAQVFGERLTGQAAEDPSSDYSGVLDWMSACLRDTGSDVLPDPPLRVQSTLRRRTTRGGPNGGQGRLFALFQAMVRNVLNEAGESLPKSVPGGKSDPLEQEKLLTQILSLILGFSQRLQQCYALLMLDSGQELLMERLENSIFQSWVLEPGVWSSIREVFDRRIADSPDDKALQDMADLLDSIDLGSELTQLLLDVAQSDIHKHVLQTCSKNWAAPKLKELLSWIQYLLYPRLAALVPDSNFTGDYLVCMAKIELARLRTNEIFDMVIDFPDSKVGLGEFRECLVTPEQRSALVDSFIRGSRRRLLHAGTDTVDIIVCYISTVRSFLILDHRGVLLDKACRPTRNYLKSRQDTVQQIVHALLDSSAANKLIELAIELRNGSAKSHIDEKASERALDWVPDPVDALPDFKKGVVEDVVESLISIFDSKDPFIEEFLKVFSKRLLEVTDYDIREIYTNLHLLKMRFGNQEFNALDVMLKDMLLSKKLDRKIASTSNVHASVVSKLYWPDLAAHSFKMPEEVQKSLDDYKSAYEAHKPGRKLTLYPSLCTVSMDVEVLGITKHFDVSADKAAILYFFEEQKPNTKVMLAIVCMKLKLPLLLAKEGLKFWATEGILEECGLNAYRVKE